VLTWSQRRKRELKLAFRFIHTADIHLDSPLRSLAFRNSELADLIGTATRTVLTNIVQLCRDEQVDALMIAGDLYDSSQSSMKTALFLAAQMRLLHEAGIQVFMIRGNHDAGSKITRELRLPDTVKVFGSKSEPIEIKRAAHELPITVHGISFAQPKAEQSLLPKFKGPVAGAFNIGLLHTSLNGAEGHDDYAPCSVTDLQATGFNYWGLGHIHKRGDYSGACRVIMPGMPQGRDIGEAGVKSVTLVTVSDDMSITVEERPTSIAQFERVIIDVTGVEDWEDFEKRLERGLGNAKAKASAEHLVARVELTGATPLYWQARRDQDQVWLQLVDFANAIGGCWIDKADVQCTAPTEEETGSPDDALRELRRLVVEKILPDSNFQADIVDIGRELSNSLPAECRSSLGMDAEAFSTSLNLFAKEGIEDVLAQLQPSEREEER
jgi:exonuclease SbcD